jgi:protein tyrosine phosphatase
LVKKITALHEINPNNGLTGFQSQFETLESSSPSRDFDCSIAKIADNIKKSRRKEYFPSNDFRVALSTTDNDSDYICASYVDGYRQRKTFIATQGPLKTTVGDFWRMVWETKSSTIIMLTSLIEDGEEQSVQYWPTSSSDEGIFGKFQVELLPEECNLPDYVVRKFKLSPVNMSHEVRTVTHFHYMSWPSSSVPFTATAINNLIEDVVRVQRKSGNGPVTVHCSDGLGRTGTFCAMFTVLERLKAEKVVDVFSTIKSLRTQRPGLLNTLEQYKFIHQAALEFVNNFENYDNFK